ncbi:MAG: Crp/Fnr family transcriptional regulator [Bacteroidota bacterium]
MKTKHIRKGEIIQQRGEINSKVFHVDKGLLRSYSIDEKGREHIFMFAAEACCIADGQKPEKPAELFIDAIEDSIVTIYEKEPEPEFKGNAYIQMIYGLQRRVIMLMSSSAIERYESFLETYPDIAQRVPQRMIASYLGITPESLSKIKRKYRNS